MRVDLVRRTEVENEDVVVAAVDRLLHPARELDAPARREPALEDRELQPVALAVHELEHPPPAPVVGDVVGDDVETFVDHGGVSAPDNADRSSISPNRWRASSRACISSSRRIATAIAEHRMGHLLVEATLVGGDESAPRMRLEVDRAARR